MSIPSIRWQCFAPKCLKGTGRFNKNTNLFICKVLKIDFMPRYRVVMLGSSGVGKTALVNQFMTSEYMHTYDASLGITNPSINDYPVNILLQL